MFYLNRPRLKSVGPVAPARCHACGTEGWARLQKTRNWLTFFSIPLLPMSRARYEIVCENCLRRKPIRGDDVDAAKAQVERSRELIAGRMEWDDYAATVGEFRDSVSDDLAVPYDEPEQPRGFA